ncbi:Rpn family recombination-promoting nuclease/putative transposase, partial [Halorhodospira halochloris]|uniref:Rpn family recombination-promoting nuclease/putative transposase n=1 Tax=Halorhodospira halochloris TaxID=1052 RepID=UPI001EE8C21A
DGRPVFLYVLIEHKSEPDPGTPVQLLGYLQRIWRRYAEQDSKGVAERYRHLPPIIPLVIYNGKLAWSVPLSLFDCIDADEELLDIQRDFGYQVRHLKPGESGEYYSQDPVIRAVFRALAWAFVEDLDRDDLIELLRDLPPGHPLEKPLLVYIARVYGYIQEKDVRQALEQTRPDRAEELVMTVAEEWIKRGEERGLQKGEAKLLLWQVEQKFGEQAANRYRERIERAQEAEIRRWSARILTADSVEDLFADD